MDFQDRLDLIKTTVDEGLAVFFTKKRQEAKKISPHCMMLVDQVASFSMRGGKRTRAFLCWLGCQSVIARSEATRQSLEIASPSEWTRNDKLICAMMGIELFQSFALIHDDIIDKDTVRRGGPTVHVKLGVPMAILAGDLALVWADELIEKVKSQKSKVKSVYQRMKEEVILGQSLDVLASAGLPSADQATINQYKTAWYSVIRPLQIGASLGGAHTDAIEAFVPYGLAVGEAYQLRDDMLDGAIGEVTFKKQAANLQKRAARAVKKINVSQSTATLLGDFARFALSREA